MQLVIAPVKSVEHVAPEGLVLRGDLPGPWEGFLESLIASPAVLIKQPIRNSCDERAAAQAEGWQVEIQSDNRGEEERSCQAEKVGSCEIGRSSSQLHRAPWGEACPGFPISSSRGNDGPERASESHVRLCMGLSSNPLKTKVCLVFHRQERHWGALGKSQDSCVCGQCVSLGSEAPTLIRAICGDLAMTLVNCSGFKAHMGPLKHNPEKWLSKTGGAAGEEECFLAAGLGL